MPIRNQSVLRLPAWLLPFALTACGGLLTSDQPAAQAWWLEPPQLAAPAGSEPRGPLVLTLTVAPGLDSDRIMSLNPEARLSPFAGAYWADDLPGLLDSLLSRSLAASGRFTRVGPRNAADGKGCRLALQATRFHARLDANDTASSVEIAFSGHYRCGEEARPVAAQASLPVSGNRMPEVIAAFQSGLQQATQELLGQL